MSDTYYLITILIIINMVVAIMLYHFIKLSLLMNDIYYKLKKQIGGLENIQTIKQ
jgi:hypothetical protein